MITSVAVCTKSNVTKHVDKYLKKISDQLSIRDELIIVEDTSDYQQYTLLKLKQLFNNSHGIIYKKVHHSRIGYSRNLAVNCARGKILIFIDDDILIHDRYIQYVKKFLKKHPKTIICVNPFRPIKQNSWSIVSSMYMQHGVFTYNKCTKILGYASACMAIRLDFVKKNNIRMNTQLRSCEDIDFCLKIVQKNGIIIFDPSIVNKHYFSTNIRTFILKHYSYALYFRYLTMTYPKLYPHFVNIYDYIPQLFTFPGLNVVVSLKKICIQTYKFMCKTNLSFLYVPHVALLMCAITLGIYRSSYKKNILAKTKRI